MATDQNQKSSGEISLLLAGSVNRAADNPAVELTFQLTFEFTNFNLAVLCPRRLFGMNGNAVLLVSEPILSDVIPDLGSNHGPHDAQVASAV